jgi:triosephosphate isomerase (TIM)
MNPLVVGNWKMNGTLSQASNLAAAIVQGTSQKTPKAAVVLAPPATALGTVQERIATSGISLAGQNCHWEDNGAFTGEISPAEITARKLAAAIRNNLRPILCVGETLDQRNAGRTMEVILRQIQFALKEPNENVIANLDIAYEPVWAIGTGHNADPSQIAEVHGAIRSHLTNSFGKASVRILYGGSVNAENATDLGRISEVNGLLVGGASLKPESFLRVVRCFDDE